MGNKILVGAIIVLVLLNIYQWIQDWHKMRLGFSLKQSVNSVFPLVTMIWMMYFFIFATLGIAPIQHWVNDRLITYIGEYDWAYKAMPYVYIITVIVVALLGVKLVRKPLLKYTDEEKEWLKKEQTENKEKLYKVLPFLKRFDKKESK